MGKECAANAIILDTETTGLATDDIVIELAVIDTSGKTLLNTLIALPDRREISEGAMRVHGIGYDSLENAERWPDVREKFFEIASSASRIISYNRLFDHQKLMTTDATWGIPRYKEDWKDDAIFGRDKWECAMVRYTEFLAAPRFLALGGRHRALGDCLACLERIKEMAEGGEWV